VSENRSYLGRMFDVLDLVIEADTPITATQVATAGGMPISSVARLATMLVERRLVQRLPSGALVPGSHLVHLGLRALTRTGHGAELESTVRNIAAQVPESVSAGLLVGDEIVLVARREPDFALRIVAQVGDVVPPHTSAMGKAMLAWLPLARQLDVLGKHTGGTDARELLEALEEELAEVRECGFARDEETYSIGQRCRAVPLRDSKYGVYGGVSVAGPSARFTFAEAEAAVPVLQEAVGPQAVEDTPGTEALA